MVQPSSFLLLLALSAVMTQALPLDRRGGKNDDVKDHDEQSKLQCDPEDPDCYQGIPPPSGQQAPPPSGGNFTPPPSGDQTPPPTGQQAPPPSGGNFTPPPSGDQTPPPTGQQAPSSPPFPQCPSSNSANPGPNSPPPVGSQQGPGAIPDDSEGGEFLPV